MTIEIRGLTKRFGSVLAVDGVDFEVRRGEVYGLIGPNGAGKTTTMRLLVGLLRPDAGVARIGGVDSTRDPLAARAQLGFHGGSVGLYPRLRAREALIYQARLYGLDAAEAARRAEEVAAELGAYDLLDRRCEALSAGQKQRVGLARASVHDPPVLVLDEPTAGLDVLASRFVADYVRKARDRQRAVLFSTHYMTEAELLCDRIGLLHRGRLVAEGAPAAVKERFGCETLEEVFLGLAEGGEGGEDRTERAL
ncbi:MAG: ABC transporter ATP-binding protein [Deltaproteobacteria bacterium]|nr:ABC transporter ATP-binding protein [Deltaproteobacteria bacterium]